MPVGRRAYARVEDGITVDRIGFIVPPPDAVVPMSGVVVVMWPEGMAHVGIPNHHR